MADVPGDVTTGATIAVGTTITDAIEVVGDHDWDVVPCDRLAGGC